jgi:hypothetical protein
MAKASDHAAWAYTIGRVASAFVLDVKPAVARAAPAPTFRNVRRDVTLDLNKPSKFCILGMATPPRRSLDSPTKLELFTLFTPRQDRMVSTHFRWLADVKK